MAAVQIGLGLALFAAFLTNLASLLKHRGCQLVEPVSMRSPLRTARRLAASPWFAAGWGVAAVGWFAHVAALSLAPISLVQAVLAGGAASLAVMAQRFFGHRVAGRQWLALFLGAAGLVLLVVTVPDIKAGSRFSAGGLLGFEAGLALLAAALAAGHRGARFGPHGGVALPVLSGTLFALAGIAIKGLTAGGDVSVMVLVPWLATTAIAGVLAQYTTVAALQQGEAIETIGLMGLVASAVQIAAGVVVFGDPLSPTLLGLILQAGAFAMVCTSALLLPVPRDAPRRHAIA
jgi:drug/metabolite transporter (DMT)-like permease